GSIPAASTNKTTLATKVVGVFYWLNCRFERICARVAHRGCACREGLEPESDPALASLTTKQASSSSQK
ncbi:MAG: hypothetical protein AB9Q18_12800, partial [Candidatus Reddybacter sp.]